MIPRRWVERTAAPHSSVAVRHRQRREQARAQGHRGIAGRGPPQAGGHRPMPRKALATARATLRFAHRAADDCGLARHHRRGLNQCERHGVLFGSYPAVPRTNAYQKLRHWCGQCDITWGLLQPVKKPVLCGPPQAACPSGSCSPFHRLEQVCAVSTRRQPQSLRHRRRHGCSLTVAWRR